MIHTTSSSSAALSAAAQSSLTPEFETRSRVGVAAIAAGLVAALALEVLFMMLGAGLGFAMYSPLTDDNPIADLGAGAVVIQGVSAVFSLWFGGWVAGRFAPLESRQSGWLHGFLVWCSATVAGILLVSLGAGWAMGDLSKVVGGGLSLAGKPAAAAVQSAAGPAADALKKSTDTVASYVDEATSRLASRNDPAATIRAKRELGFALSRLFTMGDAGNTGEARAAAVKALVEFTGVSETEADRTITSWTTSFDALKRDLASAKEQAEAKAREAAEKASHALAIFSLCYFVAFSLGGFAAAFGGRHGADSARRHLRESSVIGI